MPSFNSVNKDTPYTVYFDTTGTDSKQYLEQPETGSWDSYTSQNSVDCNVYYSTAGGTNGKAYIVGTRPKSSIH